MERHILEEGQKMQDAVTRHYPEKIISKDVLQALFDADPSKDKTYYDWMVKQNIKTSTRHEVNNRIPAALRDFELFKDKIQVSDLSFYQDLEHLEEVLSDIKNHLTPVERTKYGISMGRQIYQDKSYIIYKLSSAAEICSIGHDTAWCHAKEERSFPGWIVYVVINKKAKFPDMEAPNYMMEKERATRFKKVLVAINPKFRGNQYDADLDDYTLLDMMGKEQHCTIAELTNDSVEERIFKDYAENGEEFPKPQEEEEILSEGMFKAPDLQVNDRVELIWMANDPQRPPKGTKGTCISVQPTPWGVQYGMKWDTGSHLSLIAGTDIWKKIE